MANGRKGKKKSNGKRTKKNGGKNRGFKTAPVSKAYRWTSPTKPLQQFRIKHAEFICDLENVSTVSYAAWDISKTIAINPGLPNSFPWLAAIARNFETYKFHSLRYEFRPILATSTSGKVGLFPDYDAADNNAGFTKGMVASFADYTSDSIWTSNNCRLQSASLAGGKSRHFIRNKSLVSNLDLKTYDVGNMFVGCNGYGSAGEIGELYVHYDVTLYTPQLSDATDAESWQLGNAAPTTINTPFSSAGTLNLVASKIPVIIESGSRLIVGEAGKFVVRLGADYITTLVSALTPVVANKGPPGTAAPTINLTDYPRTAVPSSILGGAWSYIVEASDDWSLNWNGFDASAVSSFMTEIIRVPPTFVDII